MKILTEDPSAKKNKKQTKKRRADSLEEVLKRMGKYANWRRESKEVEEHCGRGQGPKEALPPQGR